MPRRHKVIGAHIIANGGQNGGGTVRSGNTRGNALAGLNGNGEVGAANVDTVALRH